MTTCGFMMADSHQTMKEQPKKLYQSVGERQVHSGAAIGLQQIHFQG